MKEQLQKDFYNSIKNLSLSQKDIEIKKFCLDNFIDKGFPNKKEEDWKFSDLNQIIKNNIGELSFYNDQASTNKVDTSVFVDGLEHNKIVFINGRIEKIDFEYEKKDQIEIIDQSETINEFKKDRFGELAVIYGGSFLQDMLKNYGSYEELAPIQELISLSEDAPPVRVPANLQPGQDPQDFLKVLIQRKILRVGDEFILFDPYTNDILLQDYIVQ
jgi:Fe-S cluster assembly protein SufD